MESSNPNMKVKIRTNMILGEARHFVPFGTLVDIEQIPPHLRKKKYIIREGERDIDAERFKAQASVMENDVDPNDLNLAPELPQTEEEVVRQRIVNRRAMRRDHGT